MENSSEQEDLEETLKELHSHCVGCHRNDCALLPDYCPVVECMHDCGTYFHNCKQAEHFRICRCKPRPCINVSNGCNAQVRLYDFLDPPTLEVGPID